MRTIPHLCAASLIFAAAEAHAAPTLFKQIALPGAPFDGIAVTPDGAKLYVSLVKSKNPGVNTIAVIDTVSATVVDEIELGDQGADNSSPRQLFMSPDGQILVHATYVDNLIFIDTATDAVIDSVPGVGNAVAVFTGDSQRLWSRDGTSKSLRVFDLADLSVLSVFPLLSPGSSDFPLLITPDGSRVYAATSNDGGNGFPEPQAITSYDEATRKLIKHYGVGVGFTANAGTDARISPDGKFLYSAGSNTTTIVKIDVASDTVVDSVVIPQYGEALNLSPDGKILYAFENGYNSGILRVHDADTLDLVKTVDVQGSVGRFLATARKSVFAPSGCAVIVPAALQTSIFALDPSTHEKIASFATPNETPYVVEFAPNSARAYLPSRSNNLTGTLTILDLGESCALTPDGESCQQDDECDSQHCVDGLCCDTACGGGSPDDCQACAVQDGAAVDGTCGPISGAPLCRDAVEGSCDAPEFCNAVDLECPPDLQLPDGDACDGGVCQQGICEPEASSSSGSSGAVDETTGAATSSTSDPVTSGAPGTSGEPTSGGGTGDSAGGTGEDTDLPTTEPGDPSASTTDDPGESSGGSGSDSAGQAIDDGCGCRSQAPQGHPWLALLGLALLRRRRRQSLRRAPSAAPAARARARRGSSWWRRCAAG